MVRTIRKRSFYDSSGLTVYDSRFVNPIDRDYLKIFYRGRIGDDAREAAERAAERLIEEYRKNPKEVMERFFPSKTP